MKLVYIAGPLTACTQWEVEQNIRRAEWAYLNIIKSGLAAHCPHLHARNFVGTIKWETAMLVDMEILGRCDAVFVVGEHIASEGTAAELEKAKSLGLPVFDDLRDLTEWGINGKRVAHRPSRAIHLPQ